MATPTPSCDGLPANAIVHGACGNWWTGGERSHCGSCHRTFTSLTAFELHRRGLRCNDPAAVGLVVRVERFGPLWGRASSDARREQLAALRSA